MLSAEQVSDFQRIFKEYFGKEISREDALEQGIKLVQMMKLIYTPITEEDLRKLKDDENETRKTNANAQKNKKARVGN